MAQRGPSEGKNDGTPERVSEEAGVAFSKQLQDAKRAFGVMPAPPDEEPSEADLDQAERMLTGDNIYEGFGELFRSNQIIHKRNALQRTAELQDPAKTDRVDPAELVVVNQVQTYHEYFIEVVEQQLDILSRYEKLRASAPDISPELQTQEQYVKQYMAEMTRVLDERVEFGNVMLIDSKLATHAGGERDQSKLLKLRDQYFASSKLSDASKQALQGATDDKWRRGNILNQRLIELLAGTSKIPGLPENYNPHGILVDFLQERYKAILDEQKRVVKGVNQERYVVLDQKNDRARDGKGPPLTEDEAREYEQLQRQLEGCRPLLESLSDERRWILQELINLTQDLALYQSDMAELTTIQHQFGGQFDLSSAVRPSTREATPDHVRTAIGEHMEQRSKFHLERMEGFLSVLNDEVLSVGAGEQLENLSNKYGREGVRRIALAIASIVTLPLPETMGLKRHVKDSLTEPLMDALGWPAGKTTWEQLTEKEKKIVIEKSQSVLDAVKSYDRVKIEKLQSTIDLIETMPKSSEFVGKEVVDIPEDVTHENRDQLIETYGVPSVYVKLFDQLDTAWGTAEPPTGLLGEYAEFLHAVNDNIDAHIDIGQALFRLGDAYMDLMKHLLYGALLGAAGLLILQQLLKRGMRIAKKGTYRVLRGGGRVAVEGVRRGTAIARGTASRLSSLSRQIAGRGTAGAAAAEGAALEGSASRLSRLTPRVARRVLGPIVPILTGWELKRRLEFQATLEQLPEVEVVEAAYEFMTTHPNINRDAIRYKAEVQALEDRLEAVIIYRAAQEPIPATDPLPENATPDQNEDWNTLQEMHASLKQTEHTLRHYALAQKQDREKFFPITDYIYQSKEDPKTVVRVLYSRLTEARQRGQEYTDSKIGGVRLLNILVNKKEPPPSSPLSSPDGLQNAYEQFLHALNIYEERVRHFQKDK